MSAASLQRWACFVSVWCYFASLYEFKLYPLSLAAVFVLTGVLWLANRRELRIDGLLLWGLPLAAYALYSLASTFWTAQSPAEARHYWLLFCALPVASFIPFYIAGRNAEPQALAAQFVLLAAPAILLTLALEVLVPDQSRSGGYALKYLPVIVAFTVFAAQRSPETARRLALYALTAALVAIAVVSRARASTAATGLALALAVLAVATGWRQRLQLAALAAALAVAVGGALWLLPQTQPLVAHALARLTGHAVALADGSTVAGEGTDWARARIEAMSAAILQWSPPYGIGYSTFRQMFKQQTNGWDFTIHNTPTALWIEGGIPACAAMLAALALYAWRCGRSLRRHGRDAAGLVQLGLGIGVLTTLGMGWFHPIYTQPLLFVLLGLALGQAQRDRAAAKTRDENALSTPLRSL